MEKLTQILSQKTSRLIIWVLIFCFPLIFIWQDGDLTDTGYHISVYHFFFDRLGQSYTESLFFLSALIGGGFYYLFPSLGVLGIKVLSMIFFGLVILLIYLTLRKKFNNHPLIPALILFSFIFGFRSFPIIFNYDLLTTFWLMLLIYLLYDIKKITLFRMFWVGAIASLMTLSLFTNIVYLILFPILFLISSTATFQEKARSVLYFFLGFSTGIILFSLSAVIFKIDHIFIEQLKSFALLSDDSSSYNLWNLLTLYVVDFMVLMVYTLLIAVLIKFSYFLSEKFKLSQCILLLGLILSLVVLSSYPLVLNYSNHIKYIVPAVLFNLLYLIKPQKSAYYFIGLLIISGLTQVAGTNTGLTLKLGFILIFVIPYVVLLSLTSENMKNRTLGWSLASFTFIYSFFLLISGYYGVGFGLFERLKFNQEIDIVQYEGIRTTPSQKDWIESLHSDLQPYSSEHQQLFIFGHVPMFYYLTDLAPTTEVYWLAGNQPERITNIINSIPNHDHTLILEQKNLAFLESNTEFFHNFMQNHGYSILKESEQYNIWSNQ